MPGLEAQAAGHVVDRIGRRGQRLQRAADLDRVLTGLGLGTDRDRADGGARINGVTAWEQDEYYDFF